MERCHVSACLRPCDLQPLQEEKPTGSASAARFSFGALERRTRWWCLGRRGSKRRIGHQNNRFDDLKSSEAAFSLMLQAAPLS